VAAGAGNSYFNLFIFFFFLYLFLSFDLIFLEDGCAMMRNTNYISVDKIGVIVYTIWCK